MNLPPPEFPFKSSKRHTARMVLALVVVLSLASLACGSTAATTTTAVPTNDPNPPPAGWRQVLREDFATDASEWGIASDHGNPVAVTVSNGKLNWVLEAEDASSYRWPSAGEALTDFMVSVDVSQIRGEGAFGLTFREQSGDLYAFEVSNFGGYTLMYGDDGGWVHLIEWTEAELEGDTAPRRIAVRAEGDHFTLYINDQQVGEFSDSRLKQGHVGLIVGTHEGNEMIEVQFDNLMIYAP